MNALVTIALLFALAASSLEEPRSSPAKPLDQKATIIEPAVGLRFEGALPGSVDPKLLGEFAVDFQIYLSPQGGDAVWREDRKVIVKDGRIDLVLGEKKPIPMTIHEATFKFLGASVNGGPEVYPRYAIVNVVYVSPTEALAAVSESKEVPVVGKKEMYSRPAVLIGDKIEKAATWREALLAARALKGDLPDYEDWYRALRDSQPDAARARAGHYEWVLPWVYDPASHGAYQRYFRGRFQGCDYMDLSPTNVYVWRLAQPVPLKPETEKR